MTTMDAREIDHLLLDSAREGNVLPITSRCDSRCVFCSHKNNPPDVATALVGVLSLDDIKRTMGFLDPGRVITIGESATPLIEGEPFSHPAFAEIISLLRRAFSDTPLEITTNGRHLTKELVRFLETIGRVLLNISLNSVSTRGRKLLMGDTKEESERAVAGVELLARSAVRFTGSLVAMPNLTGWDDIRNTIEFLAERRAEAVRVVMPAFSALAGPDVFPDADRIYGELREFVRSLSPELPCPLLVEPSCVSDLTPVASGVLKGSPAWNAGVRRDDVFVSINGKTPRCRVDAWNMLLPQGEIAVELGRADRTEHVRWTNAREGDSGITMEYDFDPLRAESLGRSVLDPPGKSLLLASELGHTVVKRVLELTRLGPDRAEVVVVENHTFGGTIRAAGLLTVDDYAESYLAWRESNPEPARLILPVESFDSLGKDLKRRHVSELQELVGAQVLLK